MEINILNQSAKKKVGIENVINYYGMVEQTGTLFYECEEGNLHTNEQITVIPRDPETLEVDYSVGDHLRVAQVVSTLPTSYPGHSILTEDLVTVKAASGGCACGRAGLAFHVVGRIQAADARGCSDTMVG